MKVDSIPVARGGHVFVSFSVPTFMDLIGWVIAPNAVSEHPGFPWPYVWEKDTGVILKIPSADNLLPLFTGNPAKHGGIGDCPRDP
jgi:hypothetical protein